MTDPRPLPALRVLRIGLAPASACELADILPNDADVREAGTLEEALDRLDPAALPDLVLLRRDDPVRPTRAALERLFDAAPLARLVALEGPWCESDGRNRDVCPAAVRVPAEDAAARIRRELEVLAGNLASLPPTASREEIFEWHADGASGRRAVRGAFASDPSAAARAARPSDASSLCIAVRSPDRAWAEDFADRLQRLLDDDESTRGATIAFVPGIDRAPHDPPAPDADLVLCDIDPWRAAARAALIDFRAAHPRAALVALSGWILPDTEHACRAAGCDSLWSKLADPDALVHAFRTLLHRLA